MDPIASCICRRTIGGAQIRGVGGGNSFRPVPCRQGTVLLTLYNGTLGQRSQSQSMRPVHCQVYLCIPCGALHFQSSRFWFAFVVPLHTTSEQHPMPVSICFPSLQWVCCVSLHDNGVHQNFHKVRVVRAWITKERGMFSPYFVCVVFMPFVNDADLDFSCRSTIAEPLCIFCTFFPTCMHM